MPFATETSKLCVFSEIYEHILFTSHLNFMCLLLLRLSCVFFANYVPKYQMSSGPNGPVTYLYLYHNLPKYLSRLARWSALIFSNRDVVVKKQSFGQRFRLTGLDLVSEWDTDSPHNSRKGFY